MIPIKEYIALLQAVAEGKTLQWASKSNPTEWIDTSQKWRDCVKQDPSRNDYMEAKYYNWRIKPEPSVKWLNECSDGTAAAYASEREAREAANYGSYLRIAVKYQEVL